MLHLRTWMLLMLAASCCGVLAAQTLEVSKSPVSVDTEYLESGTAFDHPLVALRFEATGGDVDLSGFALEPGGATFGTEVTDLACWLDDGDGLFDDQSDVLLWSGPPVLPKTTATFTAPLTISSGTYEDIWIVASFGPNAGSSLGKTYSVALSDTADVDAGGASVVFGSPIPESDPVKLVYFELNSKRFQGWLELHGSGFTPPFELTIDGTTVAYAEPQGAPTITWNPFGMAFGGDGCRLLEDHSRVRFSIQFDDRWPELPDGMPVSIQLTTASSGPHSFVKTFYRHVPACGGNCDTGYSDTEYFCTTSEAVAGWPFGLTLILLALSLKAATVAIHLRKGGDARAHLRDRP